ncbi:BT4734/BF3469 family protein [Bacteroides fluxus]|uniref:BT4734/BF3469 family protein n=1 Tax=Bacteroides fluxus TaxID=626930 RepID=UPI0023A80759|nr:VapE domain-containing protein [Bacteroides fluxus]
MKNISISLFKGYSDTLPAEVTLQQVVNLIKNDTSVREHTEKHRYYAAQGQTNAAAREKSSCPCFAVAVRFKNGKQKDHITGWTGLSLVDIDHVAAGRLSQLLEVIRADKHTLIAYRTIGGFGIRIIFPTDYVSDNFGRNLKAYANVFEQTNLYYAQLLNAECDLKCKNATRLSGLAYDPDVFFNPEATPFHIEAKVTKKSAPTSTHRLQKSLNRAVAMAAEELDQENIVYTEHSHNEYVMRMGYLLNAYGIPQDTATEWAVNRFADYDGDVTSVFHSCYRKTDEYGKRKLHRSDVHASENDNFANVEEIESFLNSQARFRQNVITGKCEVSSSEGDKHDLEYAEIDDRFVNSLWCRMSKEQKAVRIGDIRNVLGSEYVPLFNPFVEHFKHLKPWDGTTDSISQLASTVHVKGEQAVFAEYFKKWFVGVIASLFDNQVVNHEILVLIGPQGTYKTTWFNNLLPKALQRYFYVKSDNNHITKDDKLTLTEFALICLEEIDEMRPAELSQLKAMVTMKDVNERIAYAHYKEHRTHIASFCGTSNNLHFLSDPTGNRRWLPFEVEYIDNPYTHPVDYETVYTQAYALWKNGFSYWFDSREVNMINEHNTHFEVPNLERELILTYFRRPMPGEACIFVTTAYILNRISVGIKQLLSPTKIGITMKQAGFELIRSANQRGYRVVELKSEEVYRNQCATARYTLTPNP